MPSAPEAPPSSPHPQTPSRVLPHRRMSRPLSHVELHHEGVRGSPWSVEAGLSTGGKLPATPDPVPSFANRDTGAQREGVTAPRPVLSWVWLPLLSATQTPFPSLREQAEAALLPPRRAVQGSFQGFMVDDRLGVRLGLLVPLRPAHLTLLFSPTGLFLRRRLQKTMTTSTAAWRSWLSKGPGGGEHGGPSGGCAGLLIGCVRSLTPEWEQLLLPNTGACARHTSLRVLEGSPGCLVWTWVWPSSQNTHEGALFCDAAGRAGVGWAVLGRRLDAVLRVGEQVFPEQGPQSTGRSRRSM